MRRSMIGVAVLVTGILLLAGCGRPGGVDGDLADDWAPLGEAVPFVPTAGTCHVSDLVRTVGLATYQPVDCATGHRLETAHVGRFTGETAARSTAPPATSAAAHAAFAECDSRAREYLGDDWRAGRLRLGVALPSEAAWTGGARWFRCDLVEVSGPEPGSTSVARATSLRGALTGTAALRLTCFAARPGNGRQIDVMPPVACGQPHNMEFVGVWRAPQGMAYPVRERDFVPLYNGCYPVVAGFAKVAVATVRFRTGVVTIPGGPDAWGSGDRGVRCFLWRADAKFTRSMRGAGDRGLPIRTR